MKAGLIGGAMAALVALPGLGLGTLWDNSETTYGEIAREILLTGNWIVMHLNGRPSFVQPPLYFWIAAVFSSALGPTALAMRLPSALATTLMGFFTAYAVARQVGERVGIYSGIVLSCSLMQVIIGRLAIMDALLDAAVAMTIFWWFQAFSTGRNRYVIYGAIASACGFLAKGPVAPVVAVLVIAPYVLWSRRFERSQLPAPWSWVIGGLVLAFVVAPWFLAIAWQVDTHAVGMLLGESDHHALFGRHRKSKRSFLVLRTRRDPGTLSVDGLHTRHRSLLLRGASREQRGSGPSAVDAPLCLLGDRAVLIL